jgi:lipopolysaccharide heptosyltransferase II
MMHDERWRAARNILCIRLDHMGDVLMCTPAMRAIRQSDPAMRVTLLASGGGAAVAGGIAEVDEVIRYAAPWMKSSSPHPPEADLAMIAALRKRAFDAAVIFTTYSQSPLPAAWMCQLAEIPLRLAHCHENPYQLLSDWVRDPEPQQTIRHEVQRQLDLVAGVGFRTDELRLSFRVTPADAAWCRQWLTASGIAGRPWIALHPGASAPSRRYPAAHWAKVALDLASRLGYVLVFTGDAQEVALVEEIRHGIGAATYSLAGELDIGKLAAIIGAAGLLISNNTGPVHLAAALGTPIVDLYALTNPQHTPWQVPNRVLYHMVECRNCYQSVCPHGHQDCLAKVAPASVVQAAIELMRLYPHPAQPSPDPSLA